MLVRILSFFVLIIFLSGIFVFFFLKYASQSAQAATNLIANPSFETGGSGMTPWDFAVTSPADATLTQDNTTQSSGTFSAKIVINTSDPASYLVQLRQFNVPLTAGKTYTVSFDAKASSGRTITMTMQQASSPFTEYGHADQAITTSFQTYTSQFTMGTDDINGVFGFSVAKNTGTVWFDNVSVTEDDPSSTTASETRGSNVPNYGMNTHIYTTTAQAKADIDTISDAGLKSIRFDVNWKNLEPSSKGNYDAAYLSKLDAVIDYAVSKNLVPVITFLTTPAWANGSCGDNCPPTNPQDYADAINSLAIRYASYPTIKWEIWNEPNQTTFWSSGIDAYAYTQLLRKSYPLIKAANPQFIVLGGSIAFNDQSFLKAMYAAGAKGFFNGLAIHPYDQTRAPDDISDSYYSFQNSIEQMESTMATFGDSDMPLYLTEFGWDTGSVSESTRATYLAQAANMIATYNYVVLADPYTLRQDALLPADDDWGLISSTGVKSSSWDSFVGAALTNAPLPSSPSSDSSSNSSQTSSNDGPSCQGDKPSGVSQIYEIDITGTTATLYFIPGGTPYNSFTINYGAGKSTEMYSYTFDAQISGGAIKTQINYLNPNSYYSFKVRAGNGCVPGDWSNIFTAKAGTIKNKALKRFYLKDQKNLINIR